MTRLLTIERYLVASGSGFVALPGGYGTIERVLETATWAQLGIHPRGVCLLNVNGFYDGILSCIRRARDEKFMLPANAGIVVEAHSPEEAVDALGEYRVPDSILSLHWDGM